jgi:hypothetical protein
MVYFEYSIYEYSQIYDYTSQMDSTSANTRVYPWKKAFICNLVEEVPIKSRQHNSGEKENVLKFFFLKKFLLIYFTALGTYSGLTGSFTLGA